MVKTKEVPEKLTKKRKRKKRDVYFPQTVILISENHKFIHLPFSLEVKCEGFFQNRTGLNVCYMSELQNRNILVLCQIQIYIYL